MGLDFRAIAFPFLARVQRQPRPGVAVAGFAADALPLLFQKKGRAAGGGLRIGVAGQALRLRRGRMPFAENLPGDVAAEVALERLERLSVPVPRQPEGELILADDVPWNWLDAAVTAAPSSRPSP